MWTHTLSYILFLFATTHAQRGEFFQDDNAETIVFPNNPADDGVYRPITGGLNHFSQSFAGIKIYKHGVIGIGNIILNSCPPVSFIDLFLFTERYVAPYWIPNTEGEVRFLQLNGNNNIPESHRSRMVNEAEKAYAGTSKESDLTLTNIATAVYITWDNMRNTNNVPRTQMNRNSFQLALAITTSREVYAFFIYRVLNYGVVKNTGNGNRDAACGAKANIGLGDTQFGNKFSLGAFFNRTKLISSFSNIDNFEELGRYVVRLSTPRSLQVTPPTLNCGGDNPDLAICGGVQGARGPSGCRPAPLEQGRKRRNVWVPFTTRLPQTTGRLQTIRRTPTGQFGTTRRTPIGTDRTTRTTPSGPTFPPCPPLKPAAERITKEFCRWRDGGIYSHPYLCEYFVYCGVQNSRADVRKCPPGLNFNALIGVCDWESNLECNLPRQAVVIARGFMPKPRQEEIHNNICLLKGYSNVPDKLSCSHYLACANTRTIRMPCPTGLLFRVTKEGEDGICDWPRNVHCRNGKRPSKKDLSNHIY